MTHGLSHDFSGAPASKPVVEVVASTPAELSDKLHRLRAEARSFARLSPREKARLLRTCLSRFLELSPRMVELSARAKGMDPSSELAGEEWFSGPVVSVRAIRLYAEALEDVATYGAPRIEPGNVERLPNGHTRVRAAPHGIYDRLLYPGWSAEVWLDGRVDPSSVADVQASFYREREPLGAVTLILGAGNVASISVLDVLHHAFVQGSVCLLKMSPVNAFLGPLYELAFEPLVTRGFLAVAQGGPEVGAYLCDHPLIDRIHVTGSAATHDRIVFGPPGPDHDERKAAGKPLLHKPVTSELGNISPILIVPGQYSDRELDRVAWKIAGMVIQNASFNCLAGKMIVMPKGFAQRQELLARLGRSFAAAPARLAYYPGAAERYRSLVEGAEGARIERFGDDSNGALPWTLISGLDATEKSALFEREPFCSIVSETEVASSDPVEYLGRATDFVNNRVWGTLCATIMIPRRLERDARIGRALDQAVTRLRYGTVGINLWPAVGYGLGTTPWGGHPGATLSDVQSGIGWGHNSLMLDRVEKAVCRSPLLGLPEFVWYPGHRRLAELGKAIARAEAEPKPRGVIGAAWALIQR